MITFPKSHDEILEKLKEAWAKSPDKRLGQLLVDLYDEFVPPGHANEERWQLAGEQLWKAHDQELFTMLDRFVWKNTPL